MCAEYADLQREEERWGATPTQPDHAQARAHDKFLRERDEMLESWDVEVGQYGFPRSTDIIAHRRDLFADRLIAFVSSFAASPSGGREAQCLGWAMLDASGGRMADELFVSQEVALREWPTANAVPVFTAFPPSVEARGERVVSELYLNSEEHLYRTPEGGIGVASNDDVPENLIDLIEDDVPQVFDGVVYHDVQDKGAEELESRGIPPQAAHYGEWWQGEFRKATPAEIAAFLGAAAPPQDRVSDAMATLYHRLLMFAAHRNDDQLVCREHQDGPDTCDCGLRELCRDLAAALSAQGGK